MDCPYCGGPMEAGWIPGTDRILRVAWIPETAERRFLLTRTMLTESGEEFLEAIEDDAELEEVYSALMDLIYEEDDAPEA